jgi:hypothetical protein
MIGPTLCAKNSRSPCADKLRAQPTLVTTWTDEMSFRAGMCSRTAGTKGVDTVVELSETFASAGDVLIDASFAWAVDGPRDGPDVITDRPRPAPTAKTSKLIAVFSRSCRPIRDTLFFMTRPPPHGLSLLEATLCPKGGSQDHNCSRWPDVYANEPAVESEADQPEVRSVTRWGIRCAERQRDLGTVGGVTTRPRITRRDTAPELGRHATGSTGSDAVITLWTNAQLSAGE